MNTDSRRNETTDAHLAELLRQLADGDQEGATCDVDELARAHPQFANELRALWGTALVADAVASQARAADVATPNTVDGSDTLSPPHELPVELADYELCEELGRGGMGVVYRARQKSLNRFVAVKMILRPALASDEDRQRFHAEAAAAAHLDHPHIVPIYDVGTDDGQLFFSMQLIEGRTLAQQLAERPLPEREAARMVAAIAQAIEYAHGRGVVHRDLKPANVLVDRAGEPHVTDFGLAKRLSDGVSLTRTGAVLGTPSYMAPEQAFPGMGPIGPASDVYSLGTILYALVAGRPPFQGPTPVDTVLMLLEQEPLPPRLMNRKLDRDLEMIILRCLQKPPELRYASAGALADDLDAYLKGEPVSARSGQFTHVVARMFGETHHATVLENWGLLWMWHAVVVLVICLMTNWFHSMRTIWPSMNSAGPYLLLWGGALAIWAPTFWTLRRRAGPVTAVERQIAHVWGGSIAAVMLLFVVEYELGLPVLTLSPALGLIGGMVFVVKAGVLAGAFYVQAATLFATSLCMAWMQRRGIYYGITLFGIVSAAAYFLPGWKYYWQSRTSSELRN